MNTLLLALGLLTATPATATDVTDAVEALQPRRTRAGTLRFVDSVLADPAAPAALLARLGQDDAPARRLAVADALARSIATTGVSPAGLTDAAVHDADPLVRARLLVALDPARDLTALLERLASDPSSPVRAAAASALSENTSARHALVLAARDQAPEVRLAAVRALGWQGAEFDAVAACLGDEDRDVRLHAIQALVRIDPARAAVAVASLVDDPDASVRHMVSRLTR